MAVALPGKFIYLANQHVASLATAAALDEQIPGTFRMGPHHASLSKLCKVRGGGRVEEILTGHEVSVATVRNPYDWLVTCWLRRQQGESFEDYVKAMTKGPYIRDGKIQGHDAVVTLRWETLEQDLNRFLSRFGYSVSLPVRNRTPGKSSWVTYYTPGTFRLVNEKFQEDFARLGYPMFTNPSLAFP